MKKHLFLVTSAGILHCGEFVRRTEKMTFYRSRSGIAHRALTDPNEVVVETDNAANLLGKAEKTFRAFNSRIEDAEKVLLDLRQNQKLAARLALGYAE